jgi:hypothetical protein
MYVRRRPSHSKFPIVMVLYSFVWIAYLLWPARMVLNGVGFATVQDIDCLERIAQSVLNNLEDQYIVIKNKMKSSSLPCYILCHFA